MFIARAFPRGGCEIISATRSFTSPSAAVAVTTSTTHSLPIPATTQEGDFLIIGYAFGVTTGVTLNPSIPAGFTSRRSYTPTNSGVCTRTVTAFYTTSMGASISIPRTVPSGSTNGGIMLTLVVVRGVDPTTPVASVTAATGAPATGAAATTSFPSVTTPSERAAAIYMLGGYLTAAAADDTTWTGTTELVDSGGPRTNSSSVVTAHSMAAGLVLASPGATGGVSCATSGGGRVHRDGCVLVLNPKPE